jgi:ferredoxin
VFELKEEEKASIVEEYQTGGSDEGEVGEDLEDCVKSVEESCPVEVISIE